LREKGSESSASCATCKYVGIDQLLGGVWTDNESPAASLDWITGEPTAKYWVVRLLVRTVGTSEAKELYTATVSEPNAGYVLPFIIQVSTDKGLLLANKQPTPLTFNISGVTGGSASCLDGSGLRQRMAWRRRSRGESLWMGQLRWVCSASQWPRWNFGRSEGSIDKIKSILQGVLLKPVTNARTAYLRLPEGVFFSQGGADVFIRPFVNITLKHPFPFLFLFNHQQSNTLRPAAEFDGADLARAVLFEAVMNGEQLRAHVRQYVL
jgi:hypothetical protein